MVVAVKRRVHTWGGGRGERRGPKRGPRTLRKVEEEPEAPAILLCCDSTTRPCGSRPANRGLYSNSWGVSNKSPGRDHQKQQEKDGKAETPVVGGRGIIRRGRGSDRTTAVVTPARIGGHGRPERSRGRSRNVPERGGGLPGPGPRNHAGGDKCRRDEQSSRRRGTVDGGGDGGGGDPPRRAGEGPGRLRRVPHAC